MKELKVQDVNVCPADGRKGKVAKTAGRIPLSNKTNKPGQRCPKLSQQSEDENSLQLRKTSKKSGFTVFEDRAGASQTERASPARSEAASEQQTQTERASPARSETASDQQTQTERASPARSEAASEQQTQTERASPARSEAASEQQTQTEPQQSSDVDQLVTDLCTAEEPSGQYWRQLADSRQLALDEALSENEQLHQRLATLEKENLLLKDVAQQAESVMAAVQEWSEEQEQEGH